MKTVWILTEGDYSDFHVVGVYSSLENANEVGKLMHANEPYECNLDEGLDRAKIGQAMYLVFMNKDGGQQRFGDANSDGKFWPVEWIGPVQTERGEYFRAGHPSVWGGGFWCQTWANSEQHAIEICNEKRVRWLAENPK